MCTTSMSATSTCTTSMSATSTYTTSISESVGMVTRLTSCAVSLTAHAATCSTAVQCP
jgi:hypothetical protein